MIFIASSIWRRMAPGLFGLAPALACHGISRGLRDRFKTVPLDHLPRRRVNLRLGHHVTLLIHGSPGLRAPAQSPAKPLA
jgi:hypothetical protein